MAETLEQCSGCGALFQHEAGPVHRYMTSSPACWRVYGELLAAEYGDVALMQTHRLSVDTYAVQHPGDRSRPAIQSVGLHLSRLMLQQENEALPKETNAVMLRFGAHKASLEWLEPPQSFSMTVADMEPFIGGSRHADAVRDWAAKTWADWKEHHGYIRDWVSSVGG